MDKENLEEIMDENIEKKRITEEEILEVAGLAKLEFDSEELKDVTERISELLGYMEIINDVDTSSVEGDYIMSTNTNFYREDKEEKFENVKGIMNNAVLVDDMITVPEK